MSSTQADIGDHKTSLQYASFTCVLILAVTVFWHSQHLGAGTLYHYDEFYTHDRVLSFSAMQDWFTVYSLGEPSLKKPPMQYWMSAGLIEAGLPDLLALRIPSMMFAIGTMLATAILALVMFPRQVWIMPASLLLLATSDQFWRFATSALLETGAAFFATLGLLSLFASLRNRRYWPTFPLVVFFAGMQKGPIPMAFLVLALVGLALTSRFHSQKVRTIVRDRRFKYSALVACFAGFSWQISQQFKFWGQSSLSGNVQGEMLDRFVPENGLFSLSGSLERFDQLILIDEPWVRLIGLVGILLLVVLVNRAEYFAMASVVCFFIGVMVLSSDDVYPRYTLTILPLLCISASWLVFRVLRSPAVGCLATVLIAVVIGGPLRPHDGLAHARARPLEANVAEILRPLNETLRPDESVVFCRLEPPFFPPGAIHIHVPNAGHGPQTYIEDTNTIAHDMRRYDGRPVRGICRQNEAETLRPFFENFTTQPLSHNFVMWTASSIQTFPKEE
ncbi:MAG: hypothetical protein AAF636_26245 [Pseudomonadota bacterium]